MARHNKDFDEISFREVIDLITRSWRWVLLACLFAAVGTWIQFLKQPLYSAKAFISIQKTDSSPLQAMTARFSGMNPYAIDESKKLKPYVEQIYSSQLKAKIAETLLLNKAYKVIDDLDMTSKSLRARLFRLTGWSFLATERQHIYDPGMITYMLAGKIVATAGNDNISIMVRSRSPESSIYIANLILDFSVESVLASDLKELNGAKEFIETQLADVEGKIQKIQFSIAALKKDYSRLTNSTSEKDTLGALSKIKLQVTEARAELGQTRELIRQIEKRASRDYMSVNRLQRLKREEVFIKSRVNSLLTVQNEILAAKEKLPDFEQTITNLMREQEFQYMYSAELKKQLLQIDVQRISFQNKIREIVPAGPQSVFRRSIPLKKVVVGCVIACLLVLALLFVLEHLTPVVRTKKDLTDMGYSYMGNIPNLDVNNMDLLLSKMKTEGSGEKFVDALIESTAVPKYSEMQSYIFGAIRSKIIHFMDHKKKPLKVLTIISPRQGDGKTLLAARVAMVFSQIGKKVLLIDADMMKHDLSNLLDQQNKPGLAELLEHASDPHRVIINHSYYKNLFMLPAGTSSRQKSDLMINGLFEILIQNLKKEFEMIIIDTPATLLAHDAVVPMRQADMVLMSVSENLTRMEDIEKMNEEMRVISECEVGFVLNRSGRLGEYYYYSTGTNKKSA